MGLDMYLTKEISIYNGKGVSTIGQSDKTLTFDAATIDYIGVDVAYWRKANQIHNWFTKHANWNEATQSVVIDYDSLQELIVSCKAVLANHSLALTLLPPTSGFFFGSTDIDEWYFKDLEETIEMLSKEVEDYMCTYKYYASW